jgi:FAD/FMN-containing dehydrogenase/Fe-S oxidoreductase
MSIPIHTDSQTRHLYANDASMYEELPQGVCFPQNGADIQALVKQANRESFSITPRSGGTSLAGQATGNGIIMDVSPHMNQILELNPQGQYARVQPGVIRDTLNRAASKYDLLFGPDTATTNRCMLGGMIGNNSCGLFSIKHKTTREHILSVEVVLSDGSTAVFEPLTPDELEKKRQLNDFEGHIYRSILKLLEQHREQILESYPPPEIVRRNTGYALDKLCSMQPFDASAGARPFNMAELLCGSEGTLATTVSAKVRLVPQDPHRLVMVPHFDSIQTAMKATVEAVKHDPAAVELVDDIILDATEGNIEQRKNRFFLQGKPKCILIIQFEGDDTDALQKKAKSLREILKDNNEIDAAPIITKSDEIDRVWDLRKAGLGLLMGLGADERTPSFCEDTAVSVPDLPAYVNEFQKLLEKYETTCVFYAHASVGELHLRPVIDISTPEGIQKMKIMAEDIADLVHQFHGSLSGEHGDGRARAPYIPKVLGKKMMPLLQKVKEIWDPNYIFNPGKIVHPANIDEDLRISSFSVRNLNIDTQFQWRKEGGFTEALDFCNGAGVCRKRAESGGTMCPSYMATLNEKDSTRGRANLFRQLFASKNTDAFQSEELKDALDLCLSCKACKSECPANVDMARMKAEFVQGWHESNGLSAGEWFFGNAASIYPLASKFSKLSNWMMKTPVGKELFFQFFGIHKERSLPGFAPEPFRKWFRNHTNSSDHKISDPMNKNNGDNRKVALLIDPFVNYHDAEIGKAAVQVLETLSYEIVIPDVAETGRPQLSKGMVKKAKKLVQKNIPELYRLAKNDIPIIGLEPSEILTLRDEYLDLCGDDMLPKAQIISEKTYEFEEFFNREISNHPEKKNLFDKTDQIVYLHGHCHAKALVGNEPTLEALSTAGYYPKELETGCCGMAGSFGYEADHYEVSMDIGELVLFPAARRMGKQDLLCAPGFSCRHQIKDGTGRKAFHPAELIADCIR